MVNSTLRPIIPHEMNPPLKPVLISSDSELHHLESFIARKFVYGLDLETNFVDTFYNRKIRTITVGDREEQYVIDLLGFAHNNTEALLASQGDYGVRAEFLYSRLISVLKTIFESKELAPKHLKVGTNLQFDYEMLKWNLGIRTWNFYDCLLAEKKIYAGLVHYMVTGFWGLEDMAARYCGLLMSKDEQKGFDLCSPLTDKQIEYCAIDVRVPCAIMQGQMRVLGKEDLTETAKIEFDAIPAFGDMHLNGLGLDDAAWLAIVEDLKKKQRHLVQRLDEYFVPVVGEKYIKNSDVLKRDETEAKWRACADKLQRAEYRKQYMVLRKAINDRSKSGEDCEGVAFINYGSPAQLRDALWDSGFSKKKLPDTNDRTLEKLSKCPKLTDDLHKAFKERPELDFEVIDLIRLYRTTNKALTTYGVVWTLTHDDHIGKHRGIKNPYTHRIHSNINQIGAATQRTSSSDPNVQNIPRGSAYRFAFVARAGYKFITVDMSGAELRILAEMSLEPVWIEAFSKGWDVHSVCAEIIFGEEWRNATQEDCKYAAKHQKCKCEGHKKLREIAKALNFGLAYGMGPQKLADTVGITLEEAVKVFEKFKHAFPVVFKFLEKLGNNAKTYMESRELTGSRRRWKKPTWDDAKKKAKDDCKKGLEPTQEQIRKKYVGMFGAIEREGKNAPIQGANAMFMKKAMGCGFDPNGNPYLWHILEPEFSALIVNMVHDELCTEAPDEHAEATKAAVCDAMTRASGEYMKQVVMETEGSIDTKWSK